MVGCQRSQQKRVACTWQRRNEVTKGKSKQWRFQSGHVWCVVQMGFGAVGKMVCYNARTKGISAWSWASSEGDGVEVFFLTLHQCQEAEKLVTVKRRGIC